MRVTFAHILGAFLLPLTLAHNKRAGNTTATNTTGLVEGLLANGAVDLGDWDVAYQKAVAFVAQMTNEQKVTVITGGSVAALNWTALEQKDATQNPQGYDYVTAFPLSSALASTWDRELMTAQFRAVAAEFYGKGIQVTSGPTSQPMGRTPYSGRLDETLGADSYLNGIAFGIGSKAFADVGIVPGGKHFLLNEQETNRMGLGSSSGIAPYSSNADDKTIHETYLWPFYDGIKGNMGAVMCAMNKVNGTASCENDDLLMGLLKTELGFPGMVVPDVSGQSTAYGSANGGLDYGSSTYWSNATVQEGINNGSFSQALLDDKAVRNVIGYFYVGLNNGSQPAYVDQEAYVDVRANHSTIVRTNGAAAIVLLKNTNNALPLSKPRSIALFGANAGPVMAGPNYEFTVSGTPSLYQGHLAAGAGGGQGSFSYLVTPQEALNARARTEGTMIRWILNNTYTDDVVSFFNKRQDTSSNSTGGFSGPAGLSGGTSLSHNIPAYAATAQVCLAFINAFSGEGADRTELRSIEADSLVTTVAGNCNNTIVVVNTVGPRILDTWIEHENVTAVLYSSLLGQESGNSIMDVLYGDVNPSGRLPYTIAKNESDYNVGVCETAVCNFTEGNYIDYKYFDKYNVTPRFEFGYGLSYASFEYSNAAVSITNSSALASMYPTGPVGVGGKTDLWDEVVSVTADIANIGTVDGHEVAQLYVAYPDAADQPVRQLRGFERPSIASGASTSVNFSLRRRDLSYWDVAAQDWAIATGTYTFSIGASSRDLRLNVTMTI
ncbi:beta-glucosidase D [Coleophoma crateriformis]|uniref:beta-glucosidase n=1 Tax=Coleophoma crateriformis TaxID=565419 RepID=A0A3D8SXH0_9HELO|nr:beta-glucosidase D [Coleophoma crateriformis]